MYCGLDGESLSANDEMGREGGDDDDDMIWPGDIVDPDGNDSSDAADTDTSIFRTRLLALVLALVKRASSSSSDPIPVKVAKRFIRADAKAPWSGEVSSVAMGVSGSLGIASRTGLGVEERGSSSEESKAWSASACGVGDRVSRRFLGEERVGLVLKRAVLSWLLADGKTLSVPIAQSAGVEWITVGDAVGYRGTGWRRRQGRRRRGLGSSKAGWGGGREAEWKQNVSSWILVCHGFILLLCPPVHCPSLFSLPRPSLHDQCPRRDSNRE